MAGGKSPSPHRRNKRTNKMYGCGRMHLKAQISNGMSSYTERVTGVFKCAQDIKALRADRQEFLVPIVRSMFITVCRISIQLFICLFVFLYVTSQKKQGSAARTSSELNNLAEKVSSQNVYIGIRKKHKVSKIYFLYHLPYFNIVREEPKKCIRSIESLIPRTMK